MLDGLTGSQKLIVKKLNSVEHIIRILTHGIDGPSLELRQMPQQETIKVLVEQIRILVMLKTKELERVAKGSDVVTRYLNPVQTVNVEPSC